MLHNSKMILSDIDKSVIELSKKNFSTIEYKGDIVFTNDDSETLLLNDNSPIDLFILDATGSNDDQRIEYRGKTIYAPLLHAALKRMKKSSFALIHNVYRYDNALKPFFEIIDNEFDILLESRSANGVAVYVY